MQYAIASSSAWDTWKSTILATSTLTSSSSHSNAASASSSSPLPSSGINVRWPEPLPVVTSEHTAPTKYSETGREPSLIVSTSTSTSAQRQRPSSTVVRRTSISSKWTTRRVSTRLLIVS